LAFSQTNTLGAFIMPNAKEVATMAVIAAATVGLIFRVGMARELVTGIKTAPADKANPSAPRQLYV
jgi:hypothetical protein